jgi:hypothetical protein
MTLQCPRCDSPHVRRSMRRGLAEFLFKLALVLPYRCENCNSRFYRFGLSSRLLKPSSK